jgi:uncharacterized lipoprotein NlpE involved in copper resistance
MRTFTFLMVLSVIIATGCKSGEGSDASSAFPIDRDVSLPTGDNSRTSLDWAGVYEGTTPCADCDGIKTTLRLNQDETFVLSQTYLGKNNDQVSFKEDGNFKWNDQGSEIIVEAKDITIRFQVGENEVTMLDMAGNVVSGELANFYVLRKI